jgi:hypothetical protein
MVPNDASEFDIDESTEDGCAHAPCMCAAGESGYCSPHCEAAGDLDEDDEDAADDDDEMECGCGHAECSEANVAVGGEA